MQTQDEVAFDQLVQIAKRLPPTQWARLKEEVEVGIQPAANEREEFRNFLLSGPTFSNEQLEMIAETRKNIDK